MVIYRCEDTPESIFTAIYQAYEEKQKPEETRISLTEEPYLFAEYRQVHTDQVKAEKVIRTIHRQFGEMDYESICLALSSFQEEKAQAVYQTIARGLKYRTTPGHLLDALADPHVRNTFMFAKNVRREFQHLQGFVRFRELQNKVLYACIGPKNHVVQFLMPHFADRFPNEDFIVYDEHRHIAGVHPAKKVWYLIHGINMAELIADKEYSTAEDWYQELFRHFHDSVSINERENRKLQQNMLPLRYREYMVEF